MMDRHKCVLTTAKLIIAAHGGQTNYNFRETAWNKHISAAMGSSGAGHNINTNFERTDVIDKER